MLRKGAHGFLNLEVGRKILVVIALAGACAVLLKGTQSHYPVQEWLVWRYASYWLASLGWALACTGTGVAILRRVTAWRLATADTLVLGFGVGMLVFFLGMFLGGIAGLYGPVFAILWPSLLLIGSALSLRSSRRHFSRFLRAGFPNLRRLPFWAFPILVFGILSLFAVYFVQLIPDNVAYDAKWYHLRLAEQYAVEGRVAPSVEGWYQASLPHLGSFIYAWAFQLPYPKLFDKIELCSHLEFTIFLATLASIPLALRRVIRGGSTWLTWIVVFLFPGILLYDSSPTTAADHIAAYWAIPIFIAFLRTWRQPDARNSVLLSAMLSGAILTKYQSMYLLAFPLLGYGIRLLKISFTWISYRRNSANPPPQWGIQGPILATVVGLALTAPHWLKNAVWHGDPFYPFLSKSLHVRPWNPDAPWYYENAFKASLWVPTGTFPSKIWQTLQTLVTFAFVPNDWDSLHGSVPVFGFLFTLLTPLLLLIKPPRRLWALFGASYLGLALWYWTHHQDRYIQIILPWMATCVAAVLVLLWRDGIISRVAVCSLAFLQVAWGGDVYFIPTHSILGRSPASAVVDFLSSGYKKNYKDRFNTGGDADSIKKALPKDSRVLAAVS